MRSQTISITERNLMRIIAGELYVMAPNRQPRKVEIIMQKVRDAFRKDAYNDNEYYTLSIAENIFEKYIDNLLKTIPEVQELNLSQIQFDNNVSVDDKTRTEYRFSSAYDIKTSDSWKSDFIDLDAFTRNVAANLLDLLHHEHDCECCLRTGTPQCTLCKINPNHTYNFKDRRRPKSIFTFSCKYNCPIHYQICCEECNKIETCDDKCDGHSNTCGNKTLE